MLPLLVSFLLFFLLYYGISSFRFSPLIFLSFLFPRSFLPSFAKNYVVLFAFLLTSPPLPETTPGQIYRWRDKVQGTTDCDWKERGTRQKSSKQT